MFGGPALSVNCLQLNMCGLCCSPSAVCAMKCRIQAEMEVFSSCTLQICKIPFRMEFFSSCTLSSLFSEFKYVFGKSTCEESW